MSIEYVVENGDSVVVDSQPSEQISKIRVLDGTLDIKNETEDGWLFVFDSSATVDVKSYGTLNIEGKLISLGSTDGTRGQTINDWQDTHPSGIIWIEETSGENDYHPWYCINMPDVSKLDFDSFPDDKKLGRVFKWVDGVISFSDTDGNSCVPDANCNIVIPNIVLSTEDPFSSTKAAKFIDYEGGTLSLKNMSFCDFDMGFDGMGALNMNHVSLPGAVYLRYLTDATILDTHGTFRSDSSSGVMVAYSSNVTLDNVTACSVASTGLSVNYSKRVTLNKVYGIVAKRNSSSDHPVSILASSNIKATNTLSVGGSFSVKDSSQSRFEKTTLIDNTLKVEDSSVGTYNIMIESSNSIVFRETTILENGGAALSYINLLNSPKIDIVKTVINSSNANNVIACNVSFGSRISELYFEGCKKDEPFLVPNKNNGILLQNITTPSDKILKVEAPNVHIKGVGISNFELDKPNSIGSNFAQQYGPDNTGKLIFAMRQDDPSIDSGFFLDMFSETVKFDNAGSARLSSKGDTIIVNTPYRIKGVTFTDEDPEIDGQDLSNLSLEYSIETNGEYSDFKTLTGENLSSEVIDTNVGFLMKVRVTLLENSDSAKVKTVSIATNDSQVIYPLDVEHGVINFNEIASMDIDARYSLFYTDGYGTDDAVLVKDADGNSISGKISGRDFIKFTYDFAGDTSNGREPNQPIEMTLVFAGSNIAKNKVFSQVFDRGQINIFSLLAEPDHGVIKL